MVWIIIKQIFISSPSLCEWSLSSWPPAAQFSGRFSMANGMLVDRTWSGLTCICAFCVGPCALVVSRQTSRLQIGPPGSQDGPHRADLNPVHDLRLSHLDESILDELQAPCTTVKGQTLALKLLLSFEIVRPHCFGNNLLRRFCHRCSRMSL